MHWTYSIQFHTFPKDIDRAEFIRAFARACRYVESVCKGQVRFTDRATIDGRVFVEVGGGLHVNVGFDDQQAEGKIANQLNVAHEDGRVVHSIAFDPRMKWATTWFHRWFTWRADLYVVAVHELGHLLGLRHAEGESVMNPNPVVGTFSEVEKLQLLRLTAPKK